MTKKQSMWLGCGIVIGILLVGFWWLNRGYGKVSPMAYEYSKALYSACLNKNEEHLSKVENLLRIDSTETLPANERDWIDAIIGEARNGKWQSAAKKARRIMEDQIEH